MSRANIKLLCLALALNQALARPNSCSITTGQRVGSTHSLSELINSTSPIPDELDWRKVLGRVGNVSEQSDCNASWAFATAGLLEGQQVVRNFSQSLIELSKQQLVDCSISNVGCAGGEVKLALDDIIAFGGIESERDYEYEAVGGQCRSDAIKFLMTTRGRQVLPSGDEETLKNVVANYGPVAVSLDATSAFELYQGGVFVDKTCGNTNLQHSVLIVGYGKDPKAGDFWILKNSFGIDWGEWGFMRITRGVNMCGISEMATIAVF